PFGDAAHAAHGPLEEDGMLVQAHDEQLASAGRVLRHPDVVVLPGGVQGLDGALHVAVAQRPAGRESALIEHLLAVDPAEAAGVSRSVSSSSPSRRCTSLSRIVTIWAMCSRVSGWNTMTSSSRFRNSGLKVLLISSLTFSAIFSKVARVSGWEKPRALPLTM